MLYVELDAAGHARHLHYAPYLDYRPLAPDEPTVSAILGRPECAWITRELEQQAQGHAIAGVVPEHLQIESRDPRTGRRRFLEVQGRVSGADTITVTRNEILYSLNKPDDFILAIVEFMDGDTHHVHYVRRPFRREPDFGVTRVNYSLAELLARGEEPS